MKNILRPFLNKFRGYSGKRFPRDPVCGMQPTNGIDAAHDGITYSFCSDHCRAEFLKNPERYIAQ